RGWETSTTSAQPKVHAIPLRARDRLAAAHGRRPLLPLRGHQGVVIEALLVRALDHLGLDHVAVLVDPDLDQHRALDALALELGRVLGLEQAAARARGDVGLAGGGLRRLLVAVDRKSTRLNSSHVKISYAV